MNANDHERNGAEGRIIDAFRAFSPCVLDERFEAPFRNARIRMRSDAGVLLRAQRHVLELRRSLRFRIPLSHEMS